MSLELALPDETIIAKIADGAFLRDMAIELGIDKRRLSERLRKHPDYQSAKECSIECQLDAAQIAIECAREAADIARAREQFRAAAWRAEREFPHRWGAHTQVTVSVDLGSELQKLSEKLREKDITSECTAIAALHNEP